MKPQKKLNLFVIIIATSYMMLTTSCGNEYLFASESDCKECMKEKPDLGKISISLSENTGSKGVWVKVYKGKYTNSMKNSDNALEVADTVHTSSYDIEVPVDQYYSVVAEYSINGKKYLVVDGDKLKLYSIKNTCDFDCWITKGGDIDCRLRN